MEHHLPTLTSHGICGVAFFVWANATLSVGGFTTGSGVAVSQVESVSETGDLTGTVNDETFQLQGADVVSVTSPQPVISFDGVEVFVNHVFDLGKVIAVLCHG